MSQHDPYGPGTGPLSPPAPPPFDQQHGQPGPEQPYGQEQAPPGYPAASSPPPGYGYGYGYGLGPPRTNVMAILGLVFAFLFSPLGIVFSAIGLSQIRKRGEKGRGLALAGLIVSVLLLAISALTIALAVSSPTFRAAYESARASASSAAADDAPAPAGAPAGGAASGTAGPGVKAACQTIVPALMNLEADLQDVRTPTQYSQALATLESTMSTAADGAADPQFQQDVAQLNADLEKASAAVRSGQDASALESALNADGQAVGEACASAGFTN